MSDIDDPSVPPSAPPNPPPPAAPPPVVDNGTTTNDERTWGLLAHLSALCGFVIPFGNLLGPLVIWQIKKNEMPFVDDQGKEALNFQITLTIEIIVSAPLCVILIGFLLLPIVGLYGLVMTIIGGVKANNGERYRYPLTLRLIN
jgi:uncharacterized Tic20 family protein